jgi:hypothetical protein
MKRLLWALVLVSFSPGAGSAASGVRTPIAVSVSPHAWHGACPHRFQFTATLTSRGAGEVVYHWERSDGATSQPDSTTFKWANEKATITTEWIFSRNKGEEYQGWYQLVVTQPNLVRSPKAMITMQCVG